jgi:biofilm PGA synthesis N-glycosyltransferase PgaC
VRARWSATGIDMAAILWLTLGLLTFTYVGYPALMAGLARLRPRPVRTAAQTPHMDVLLVVHDGADLLAAKLANLLALDYPRDRLRINIVSDGCEASEAVARCHLSAQVRLFAFSERRGKSACIGSILPLLDAELVLFTDVRQRLDVGAARALAAALADPAVGAASGELVFEDAAGYGKGIDAYWRYEKMIRRLESASGSLVGATGALYAARRAILPTVPAGLVLDDMWIPLGIAAHGYRVVFVPQALAYDRAAVDAPAEETRKRRTLAGNYQLLHRWPRLAVPGAHPLALRLWGHKWLRLFAPWLLLAALAANVALVGVRPFYAGLFAMQLAGYGVALVGRLQPAALALAPVRIASAFVSLNLSAARALFDYLRDPNAHLWTTRVERACP